MLELDSETCTFYLRALLPTTENGGVPNGYNPVWDQYRNFYCNTANHDVKLMTYYITACPETLSKPQNICKNC